MASEITPRPLHPVLLVDDEEQALTSMSITLRSAGFDNLRTCADSREVPGLLEKETFSVVVADLNMPHVSGHDLIRLSAAMPNRPPFIIVTASTRMRDYADGAAGGAVDYLVKPISRDHLIAAVSRALALPAGGRIERLTRSYLLSERIVPDFQPDDASASGGVITMLEQARKEYRRLIGSLPMPYVLMEQDSYRICSCNDAFAAFAGLPSAAAARQIGFLDLLDEAGKAKVTDVLQKTGELRDEELQGRTPAGRSFVIVGSFRLSPNEGHAEGAFVDVTAHKRIEQELARVSRLQAVGRLAAGLAHDFNNTLQVISGYAGLISSEEGTSSSVRESAGQIRAAAAKADVMIRQLFSMGRAARRVPARIDLNRALRESESSLRQHLRAGHSLVLSLEAADSLVDIPVSQVDQVVRNLVLNARDAMPDGGTVTIATRSGVNKGSARNAAPVLLEVRDSGTGMDEATLQRIFEPFFTTKPEESGSGLGLSMVQLIVEAAGGTMSVESRLGSGTVVRIQLPSASVAAQEGPNETR